MRETPRSGNFIANNPLRTQFLSRSMAAHSKNHKVTRRKAGGSRPARRHSRGGKAAESSKTSPVRDAARPELLPADPEEPRPEDLAKEEPIKVEEVAQVTAAIEAEHAGPRSKERGAY